MHVVSNVMIDVAVLLAHAIGRTIDPQRSRDPNRVSHGRTLASQYGHFCCAWISANQAGPKKFRKMSGILPTRSRTNATNAR